MPGASNVLVQRPKMTRAVYLKLKAHIMRERERRKIAEHQVAAQEKERREREEQRKCKQQEDNLAIENIDKHLVDFDAQLAELNEDKKKTFSELKRVLEEDKRKKDAPPALTQSLGLPPRPNPSLLPQPEPHPHSFIPRPPLPADIRQPTALKPNLISLPPTALPPASAQASQALVQMYQGALLGDQLNVRAPMAFPHLAAQSNAAARLPTSSKAGGAQLLSTNKVAAPQDSHQLAKQTAGTQPTAGFLTGMGQEAPAVSMAQLAANQFPGLLASNMRYLMPPASVQRFSLPTATDTHMAAAAAAAALAASPPKRAKLKHNPAATPPSQPQMPFSLGQSLQAQPNFPYSTQPAARHNP